jgi:hypothetical protein
MDEPCRLPALFQPAPFAGRNSAFRCALAAASADAASDPWYRVPGTHTITMHVKQVRGGKTSYEAHTTFRLKVSA